MRPRTLLLTAAATAALTAVPLTAQAQTVELIDRAMYDGTVERTAGSIHLAAATRGELGGFLDVTVMAEDGTLPAGSNACEPGTVDATLTVSPGETLSARVPGGLCTSFSGDALTVNATITKKDLVYVGTAHDKAKLVGEGFVAVGVNSFFGGQASFSAAVKW